MRLTSAAEIDISKAGKADECAKKLAGLLQNNSEGKGDKVKIVVIMMGLENLLKQKEVLYTYTYIYIYIYITCRRRHIKCDLSHNHMQNTCMRVCCAFAAGPA